MPTTWEIEENVPPADPPAESLAAEEGAGELTDEDVDAIGAGVLLPADAEGEQ